MYNFDNRFNTGLGVVEMELLWEEDKISFDPNKAIMMAMSESVPFGKTITVSDISGEPAYVYRSNQIELGLTADEFYRMTRHSLEAQEHQILIEKFGSFYEISSSFYDMNDGTAWQPKVGPKEYHSFFQKCMRAEAMPEEIDDYVDMWHNQKQDGQPLHRFLGMSKAEYSAWATQPSIIYKLLFERLRDVGY